MRGLAAIQTKFVMTLAVVALSLCIHCKTSEALVVYDNLGPGDSYNPNIGWGVYPYQSPSMQFATSGGGLFSQLTIAVGNAFDNTLQVHLHADNNGLPGAILETLIFMVEDRYGGLGDLQIVAALGTTALTANTWYWLTAVSSNDAGWYYNNTGANGYTTISGPSVGNSWSNSRVDITAAFRIEVADIVEPEPTPVHEPASLTLVAVGLAGLGFARRRRPSRR